LLRAANRLPATPPRIPQDLGGGVHEAIADLDRRPERCPAAQGVLDQTLERGEFPAQAPFFPTRARRSRIEDQRSFSFKPLGRNGGRPSSVIADRTAEQYPRTASAA